MTRFLMPAALALATLFSASAGAQQHIKRDPAGDLLTLQSGDAVRLPVCMDSEGAKVRFSIARGQHTDYKGITSSWDAFSTFSVNGAQTILNTGLINSGISSDAVTYLAEHECVHHERGHIRKAYLDTMQGLPLDDQYGLELEADCGAAQSLQKKYGWGEMELRGIFNSFPQREKTDTHPSTAERLEKVLSCLVP